MKRYVIIAIGIIALVQVMWISLYLTDRARVMEVVGAPVVVQTEREGFVVRLKIVDDKLLAYAHETHARDRLAELAERDRWIDAWGVIITVDDSIPGWQLLPVINHLREIGVKRIQIEPVGKNGEA